MIQADLKRTATFESMIRVDAPVCPELEFPSEFEGVTNAGNFGERNGYEPEFLVGWDIPLPVPIAGGLRDGDACPLKDGSGVELRYRNFSTVQSIERRLPLLTAVNIDGFQSKSLPRTDKWNFDGRLDEDQQWGDTIYKNNILDRGHMVRREDPVWGEFAAQANVDTFHFTNSCPQIAGVNQQTWLGLENYVLQNARADNMRVSVFTGPYFSEFDLEYRGAKIPLAFWKVVAIVTDGGRPSATAYKVSQEKELGDLEFVYGGYKTFQISIASVIEKTGLDFTGLLDYDGFSVQESVTNAPVERVLESLQQVVV